MNEQQESLKKLGLPQGFIDEMMADPPKMDLFELNEEGKIIVTTYINNLAYKYTKPFPFSAIQGKIDEIPLKLGINVDTIRIKRYNDLVDEINHKTCECINHIETVPTDDEYTALEQLLYHPNFADEKEFFT